VLPRYVTEFEMLFGNEALEETVEVGREKALSDERTCSSTSFSLATKYDAPGRRPRSSSLRMASSNLGDSRIILKISSTVQSARPT
jgi:hypothetical protein